MYCDIQAPLWASRKQLTVLAGALRGVDLSVAVSPFAAQANQDLDLDEDGEAGGAQEALDLVDENGYSSPLIRKFFQVLTWRFAAPSSPGLPRPFVGLVWSLTCLPDRNLQGLLCAC